MKRTRKPRILKARVMEALGTLMEIRRSLVKDQAQSGDVWKHSESLQAYRDIFECFKRSGVIADYNLATGEIDYGT